MFSYRFPYLPPQGFSGDGYLCQPRVSCLENRNLCDPNADCAPVNPADWNAGAACRCRTNFLGDGYSCKPVPTFDGNYLIASQGMALMKVPFTASKAKPGIPLLVRSMQTATGLDVDCLSGKVTVDFGSSFIVCIFIYIFVNTSSYMTFILITRYLDCSRLCILC